MLSKRCGEIIYAIALIGLILFSIFTAYNTWQFGKKAEDYTTICLGGHTYYRASYFAKGYLAIDLDDDGKPVSCEE